MWAGLVLLCGFGAALRPEELVAWCAAASLVVVFRVVMGPSN